MCLAVPMKLVERDGEHGVGDTDGVRTRVMLTLTPEAEVGDYLIVHAGYALSIMDESDARETERLLHQVNGTRR